jgi:hypothetical protein
MTFEQLFTASPGWAIFAFIVAAYLRHEIQTRNGGTREQKTLDKVREAVDRLAEAGQREERTLDCVRVSVDRLTEIWTPLQRERLQRIDETVTAMSRREKGN